MDPSMNDNGVHVGGITGFLKSVGFAIKVLKPTRVILVFDGKGGSQRRRKLYPDYKGKRKVAQRYNRAVHISNQADERESMKMQLGRLIQYLETLPMKIIIIDNIEADDVIAHIVANPLGNEQNMYYIMSTDKDFYQLVSENVHVWSPTKKKLYTPELLLEEYGITSNNFIMYRILDGDVSDNIDGVKGIGIKTIHKKLPILSESTEVTIDSLLSFRNGKDGKVYESLLNSEDLLRRNFQLMQLKNVDISGTSKLKIIDAIRDEVPRLNRWNFEMLAREDYINGSFPNLEHWLKECFDKLNSYGIMHAK